MATTTFEIQDAPTNEQLAAETAALEQGEKLAQIQQEDLDRKFEQVDDENNDVSLIGGKFKSQDDLLNAYNELQKKLGQDTPEETDEATEEVEEAPEEAPTEDQSEVVKQNTDYMVELQKAYGDNGELPEEAIEHFSKMDPKDLIQSYLAYSSKTRAGTVQQSEINAIKGTVGGEEAYNDMLDWARTNLNADEISDFNAVTGTGNVAAIKFAVDSLGNRWKSDVGYEAPLVTGKGASSRALSYRSNAELSRDIADPRYQNDPAFRQDVEAKLSRSKDLLQFVHPSKGRINLLHGTGQRSIGDTYD